MQARGIDGLDEPLVSIEEMAAFHLHAIREVHPHGPYALMGYSLGRLVALEMALNNFPATGKEVALLVMMDAYLHAGFLSLGQRMRLVLRQARRGLHIFKSLRGAGPYQPPAGLSLTPAMQRVRDSLTVPGFVAVK